MYDDVERTITSLYEAATSKIPWDDAIVSFCQLVDAEIGAAFGFDPRFDPRTTVEYLGINGYDPDEIQSPEYTWQKDPWSDAFDQSAPFVPEIGSHHVPIEIASQSPAYQYIAKSVPIQDVLWVKLAGGTPFFGMGLYNLSKRHEFSEDTRRRAALVVPHYRNAVEVFFRITSPYISSAFLQLSNSVPYGVMVLSREGKIISANQNAERILARGVCLSEKSGLIHCNDAIVDKELKTSLRRVTSKVIEFTDTPGKEVLLLSSPEARDYLVGSISRFGETNSIRASLPFVDQPAALLMLSNPEVASAIDFSFASHLFQCTPAETQVLKGICSGLSVKEIAANANISENAIRFHLKSLYQKTDTKRQIDLVHMVLTSPVISQPHIRL